MVGVGLTFVPGGVALETATPPSPEGVDVLPLPTDWTMLDVVTIVTLLLFDWTLDVEGVVVPAA